MELKTCSNCLSEVVPTASGQCPSCRKPFVALGGAGGFSDNPFEAPVKPPIFTDASGPTESGSPFATANPYQAPSVSVEEWQRRGDAPRERSRIVWMFFSTQGRIGRASFWGFTLVTLIAYYIAAACIGFFFFFLFAAKRDMSVQAALWLDILIFPVMILFLWATIAIQVKRWHDHDMSGWWWFLWFVPAVGPIVALVLLGFVRGTIGRNQFGDDPREST